ncbi:MAG: sigma 54-interacting transcriptional regulator, partial [Planctomycetes bacterium]|nr:sigma 54-interacting transcriptional regulator [Planctomycetota bacterium]
MPLSVMDARIHTAVLDLCGGDVEGAVRILKANMKNANHLRLSEAFCESALLLSKCYSLQNLPHKAAAVENRIKPVLGRLDIVWLYEKNREFDILCRQLKDASEKSMSIDDSIPKVLVDTINNHHKNSPHKDMLIGGSAAMHEVYKMVEKIAPTDLPVLIQGETGTGKELIAHAIHNN